MSLVSLRVVNPATGVLLREVDLPGATTMHYAAMHVAERAGMAAMDYEYQLFEYPSMAPVPGGDIVAEWDSRPVCLARARPDA